LAEKSTYALKTGSLGIELSKYFCKHEHQLIHKACGWMLREVGKRSENTLINFLRSQKSHMPKIMMRYACEKIHISKINNNIY
jgi:3-methyladenine DNA glycosylase AlkD